MKEAIFPLHFAKANEEVTFETIIGGKDLKIRLADMGLHEGTKLKLLQSCHSGACIVIVRDTRLAIDHEIAKKVMVKKIKEER